MRSAPDTDTALLSDADYVAHQARLEDDHPEAIVSTGVAVPGLADINPPF